MLVCDDIGDYIPEPIQLRKMKGGRIIEQLWDIFAVVFGWAIMIWLSFRTKQNINRKRGSKNGVYKK